MNVDRIARAMIAGGPTRGFTARVMAPIHGRPRPDFTARVMQRVAAAGQQPRAHSLRRRALVLVPAALAVAAGVVALRSYDFMTIATPAAPMLAFGAPARTPVPSPVAGVLRASQTTRPSTRRPRALRTDVMPEAAPIYTIAALDAPSEIDLRPIGPSAPAVLPLAGPAPLKVTDLPGAPGGSRDQKFKERP